MEKRLEELPKLAKDALEEEGLPGRRVRRRRDVDAAAPGAIDPSAQRDLARRRAGLERRLHLVQRRHRSRHQGELPEGPGRA